MSLSNRRIGFGSLYMVIIAHLSVLYSDDQKFKTFCDDDLIPNLILEKTS
jgi:hypothetical protein